MNHTASCAARTSMTSMSVWNDSWIGICCRDKHGNQNSYRRIAGQRQSDHSLVAVDGEEVLGHILFSLVTTNPPSGPKGLGLALVAVRPDVQWRFKVLSAFWIREGEPI